MWTRLVTLYIHCLACYCCIGVCCDVGTVVGDLGDVTLYIHCLASYCWSLLLLHWCLLWSGNCGGRLGRCYVIHTLSGILLLESSVVALVFVVIWELWWETWAMLYIHCLASYCWSLLLLHWCLLWSGNYGWRLGRCYTYIVWLVIVGVFYCCSGVCCDVGTTVEDLGDVDKEKESGFGNLLDLIVVDMEHVIWNLFVPNVGDLSCPPYLWGVWFIIWREIMSFSNVLCDDMPALGVQHSVIAVYIQYMHEIIYVRGFRTAHTRPMWINSRECVCSFAVCLRAWRGSSLRLPPVWW